MDLSNATFEQLLSLQTHGESSAVELTQAYLDRIESLDVEVNAVIELNPDAIASAHELDEARANGAIRGPLHGLPILIKDNIDTGDRMATTAGSIALEGSTAPRDAFLVERLRVAGAIILGKANLSEWANFRSTRSSTGWSSRGGQTRNPYALDRSPGGSSSGSGVATACGFCAAAIGTETDGSIVIPAAMNSLVGIKPTLGLVSRRGVIPIAHSQDTAGPLARTVSDAARLLIALLGRDAQDAQSIAADPSLIDLLPLDAGSLRGARIGVPRSYCGYHEGIDAIVEDAIRAVKECGAEVIDEIDLIVGPTLREIELTVFQYEFKAGINAYLSSRGDSVRVKTLAELIEFNEEHAARTMPFFGQEQLIGAEEKGDLSEPEYRDALATVKRMAGRDGIDAKLGEHGVDALLAPTVGAPWMIDPVNGDHRSPTSAPPAAIAGYPSVTVPAGYLHGLPIGVSFFGTAQSDAALIQFAYAYEQATQVRRPPMLR